MDWSVSILAALGGLGFVITCNYLGYLRSRRAIARAYRELAARWNGRVNLGSFYRPPRLCFASDGIDAELTSFYLYRGRTGNYTQICFDLKESHLQAFVIRPSSERGYQIESARPSLPERLLDVAWTEPMATIEGLTGSQGTEVRFDGSTLLVRKRALLMKAENLNRFKEACEGLLESLRGELANQS